MTIRIKEGIRQKRGCQPFIADRAAWEKTIKGRAGIRWNSVAENIWKDLDNEQVLSIEKFYGYKTEAKQILPEYYY